MPYKHPTLSVLRQQAKTDIKGALPSTGGLLRFSNLGIVADVQAGLSFGHYGYLDYIALQCTPYTATDEYLEGWAALKNIYRKPATAATCPTVQFTGTVSNTVPKGAILNRADGYQYSTNDVMTISSTGTGTVSITAILPNPLDDPTGGGVAGNGTAGTLLNLDQSFSGVQAQAVTSAPITGGSNIEKDDPLRTRMLLAYQETPQGGNSDDFIGWALSVPGITRAWCAPWLMGGGTVGIYIMCDGNYQTNNGFPIGTDGVSQYETWGVYAKATGDQLRVADYIYPLQPVPALTYVASPIPKVIDFAITGIIETEVDLTLEISVAISQVFFLNGDPTGDGLITLSSLNTAIGNIPGTDGFLITSPAANIPLALGELPQLGNVVIT